ncbi:MULTISPECIES: efflux RND transporter permease subunit [unclassified Arsukibacterium]|uniref:efflux RND transporter permease subunit n=1 Tax=unclassified Arsukibacterium TaxID=2635278 RepID=UPI000C897ED9|nr:MULTISPECIES: CusA/CzcA family heavy metal efflux RND transporter [unclassified Arsukibacterium]MAA95906.1 CusA/CzcA family heavy metal efflux RND transporter [Rheinheimera sp.]HAW92769.1 CusA/CzcA family heavy metal efflux RND transporter [Candidatus Azambacteria bacterium]|tara:strand:- start:139995 stop:143147 length:3153 start_codon:yes stop_codon:yes gene_type:complete
MINMLLKFALSRRYLVLGLTLLLIVAGLYNAQRLPMDAVPDITNVQVQINTAAPGYSPLEAEQRLTIIIENAMAGLPKLQYSRSLSRYGMSQVTVVFNDSTDIYWARQQVAERLQTVRAKLPAETNPTLGPVATGLGEIFMYTVSAAHDALKDDGTAYSAEDLRTLQDWVIKPQLVNVKGVTEVNTIGGYQRQYQVAPDPARLLAFKLTLDDIANALERNNSNVGAGYIEQRGEQWLLRSPGQLRNLDDISSLIIAKHDDAPVRLRDVADVYFGKELRTGAASLNGEETVLGTVFMLMGENSRTVSRAVAEKLLEVNRSLPDGVSAEAVYNRTTLVDKTIATVQKNLFEGAVLVIVVLFVFLGNIRAALITALVIPLSMLFAISGMALNKVSGNLMSLGAIDFGLMVDGAVIVVENCLRRLGLAQHRTGRLLTLEERLSEVYLATREVFTPAVFGVLIIMLVFLPIFALRGVEGKMFHPMAFTVIAALAGAVLLAITFVPAAVAIFVRGKVKEQDSALMHTLKRGYSVLLRQSLRHSVLFISGAVFVMAVIFWQGSKLGSEFMPQLDEGDIALHALRIPGTGLNQSLQMQLLLEREIAALPQVKRVFSKLGTAEIATDPMPPNVADTFVMLKPKAQWPDPGMSKADFVALLRQTVADVPGNNYEFTQPIEMRFNELIAGVRSDVALRIYGDDLNTLARLAEQATALLATVPGAVDVRMEQANGLPMLSIEPDREHLALLGIDMATVQRSIQTMVGGIQAGLIYEGDKAFDLIIRADEALRSDPQQLKRLPVALPFRRHENSESTELTYVPLGEVAHFSEIEAPNQINRESAKRNIVVSANVSGRDLGSFITDTKQLITKELALPTGYWLGYDGTFEQLQSASDRLMWVVPLTLLMIFGLLFSALNSAKDALLVFSGVPLALTGGLAALILRDMPLSISAAVGFIALSGIAVLNGVVMLAMIKQLQQQGLNLLEAIEQGALQRLRPVLMTALVASLGFVPMAFNSGTGAEVQRPLATVVIGGIISATLLTLLLLPTLYKLVHQRTRQPALA